MQHKHIFLQVPFIKKKLNYMEVLSFFILKVNSIQTPAWPVLYVYQFCYRFTFLQAHQSLLLNVLTPQTEGQYSYYAKNVKGCLFVKVK